MKKLIAIPVALFVLSNISCLKREETYTPIIYHGSLQEVSISPSDPLVELAGEKKAFVYLPPGYDSTDTLTLYPVVYLLHGYGGNYRFWQDFEDISEIADYLISTWEIRPIILVMPDGFNLLGGSFYTNSLAPDSTDVFGRFEDYITNDVVSYIDNNFNTLDSVSDRGIIGISMGAYGAMRLAFKHPDVFHAVGAHSGPVAFDDFIEEDAGGKTLTEWVKLGLMAENGGRIPCPIDTLGNPVRPIPDPDRPLTSMLFAMAGAFTPRISSNFADTLNYDFMPILKVGDSYKGVLLPFDTLFSIKLDVWDVWSREADIVHLAEENKDAILQNDLKIYFDCGYKDELYLTSQAETLHNELESLGIPHQYEIFHDGAGYPPDRFPAGHGTHLYLRVRKSLDFVVNEIKGEGPPAQFIPPY